MFDLKAVRVPNLAGKTILVTGAGRGIGAYVVAACVQSGARVIAGIYSGIDEQCADLLTGAETVLLDVTNQDSVNAVIAKLDKLDVLINNAGVIAPIGHLETLESDALLPAFEVNVAGVHRVSVAALPLLKASKGTIINAGTGAATTAMEGWTAYCSTKAGARMLSLMMDLELKPYDIKTFFIGIPPTDTDMQTQIRGSQLNPISKIKKDDLVEPTIPASVLAWLASNDARKLDDVTLDVRDPFFQEILQET